MYIYIARIIACDVGVFFHNWQRYTTHLFKKPLSLFPMGVFLRDYSIDGLSHNIKRGHTQLPVTSSANVCTTSLNILCNKLGGPWPLLFHLRHMGDTNLATLPQQTPTTYPRTVWSYRFAEILTNSKFQCSTLYS